LDRPAAGRVRSGQQPLLAALQQPIPPACITTRVGPPRWRDLASWFLVAEQDYLILPETQRFMAQRMRAHVRTRQVDHTPMVTAPTEVVEIIREGTREMEVVVVVSAMSGVTSVA